MGEKQWNPIREIQTLVTKPYQIALNRSQEMIIHRLRLGIIGLNEDLHKLGRHENGHCDHCPELETVDHFLISCPKYIIPRAMLLTETNLPDTCMIKSLLKSHSPETQRFKKMKMHFSESNQSLTAIDCFWALCYRFKAINYIILDSLEWNTRKYCTS